MAIQLKVDGELLQPTIYLQKMCIRDSPSTGCGFSAAT